MFANRLGASQLQDSSRFAIVNDPLSVIYNEGQWRMSKVSAMYNLQYSAVKLKQYMSKIKQIIASSVPSGANTNYVVQVEGGPLLKYSEEDPDALMITVFTTTHSEATTKEKKKVAYDGILLSWGMNSEVPDCIHLPYMLERGEQRIGTAVKSALGTMFDCKIMQYIFSQDQILRFGFNFVETETSSLNKNIAFKYTSPRAEHKDSLTMNFEVGDINLIWRGIKEEATKKTELVSLAYQTIQNQIFYMFAMDISALDLCEISLPSASVKKNGTVKMKTPEMVNCVLTVLNEICSMEAALFNR